MERKRIVERGRIASVLAWTAVAGLAAGCTSGTSTAQPPPASTPGATSQSSGYPAPSSSSGATVTPGGPNSSPPGTGPLTAGTLKSALLTDADLPGYRGSALEATGATAVPTGGIDGVSGACATLLNAFTRLQQPDNSSSADAGEFFQSGSGPGSQPSSVFVQLRAFRSADAAGALLTTIRGGISGCKVVQGGGYGRAPITPLPVPGLGGDVAAFALNLGAGLFGATGYLTVRVGSATATIEILGIGSDDSTQQNMMDQLKAVADKQVARLRTATGG